MVVEVVAGLAFGSMALLADGLHMASHATALSLTVLAYVYCRRRAGDPRFAFGTGKVNSLGGYTSALLLVGFALYMAVESVSRLVAPVPIAFDAAIAVAVVGLIVNGLSVFILDTGRASPPAHRAETHQDGGERHRLHHGPHHGHGHAHHDHNLRGAYLHVLADALTSLLAIVALIAGKYLGTVWMDPLMGIVGACLVSRWAYALLRDSGRTLLDRQAPGTLRDAVRGSLERFHDTRVVDLHVWSIGPGLFAGEIAVVSHQPEEPSVYKELLSNLGLSHVTIEVHRCPGEHLQQSRDDAAGPDAAEWVQSGARSADPKTARYTETRRTRVPMNRPGDETTKAVPSTGSGQSGIGHPHIDARSLDMARIVVERIDVDRSLVRVAHENLERERQLHGTLSRASAEWEQILKRTWTEIRAILLDGSDEGQRLRSSHPFRGIVTEEERLAIIARHPPPWPHEPYDRSKVPQEVMEEILSEGNLEPTQKSGSGRRRDDPL